MLYNQQIKIYKHDNGEFIKGVWVKGIIKSIITLNASVQPISGRDLLTLPEGERTNVRYKVYFENQDLDLTINDLIYFENRYFKIINDNNWFNAPFLNHTKIFLGDIQ